MSLAFSKRIAIPDDISKMTPAVGRKLTSVLEAFNSGPSQVDLYDSRGRVVFRLVHGELLQLDSPQELYVLEPSNIAFLVVRSRSVIQ